MNAPSMKPSIRASTNELRTARFDAPALPKLEDLDDDCEAILLKRVKRLMAVLGVTDAKR